MCDETDIKEMGIPMGPRKKLLGFIKERKEKQVFLYFYNLFSNYILTELPCYPLH